MAFNSNLFIWYEEKARREAEAYEVGTSTFQISNNGKVIPYAEDDGVEVMKRISGLVTSIGSKILNRKLDGISGPLVITASDRAKKVLNTQYDIRELIELLARDLIVKGSAGLAVGTDVNGNPVVYRLGGFIVRVPYPYDVDKTMAILQAQQDTSRPYSGMFRWQVRIFSGSLVQEWRGLQTIQEALSATPTAEYANKLEKVAFFTDYQTDDSGYSIGEIEQMAPLLKGIMAVEARIHRVSEIFGFPRAVISGTVQDTPHSPSNAIVVSEGGKVQYLTPADLSSLLNQKKDLLKQLDDMAILPAGQVLGYEPPSGNAIQEANKAFNNNVDRYARNLSTLLTKSFRALFQALNIDPGQDFSIRLTPNKVEDTRQALADAIAYLDKGVLPIDYVIKLLRREYPDMTDAEATQIIQSYQERTAVITPAQLGLG